MKNSATVSPPPQSTARWLQGEVRRAIIEMEFAPGARLSEHDLAARYEVSRQPVREAMISLANDNFVDIRPQRGTFVSHLSLDRILQSRLIREAIETAIIEQGCCSFDLALTPAFRTNLEIQRVRAEAGDRAGFQAADAEFHALLARGVGFPHAWETIRDLKQHTDRICTLTLSTSDDMLALLEQHRAIFAAVCEGATSEAVRLTRSHLTGIQRVLQDIKRQFPDWFE
jgi:GntR family transcriptional regulator, rspAB operon transcriptional repressor